MDGCKIWKRILVAALGVVGLTVAGSADLQAQCLQSAIVSQAEFGQGPKVDFVSAGTGKTPAISCVRENGPALWQSLRSEWEAVRTDLTRSALETTLTMFYIRSAKPPPPPPPPPKGNNQPPQQQGSGDPPPPPPAPPPPGGTAEPPQLTPPTDPPHGTPEPASIVTAILGTGLVSWFGWRRRSRAGV